MPATRKWTIPVSEKLQSYFPRPCKPSKFHKCRLCGSLIERKTECCQWSNVESGEGWGTWYTHPECYQATLDQKWDEGDWECMSPGDMRRPTKDLDLPKNN
jgi:hypothetical protein